jgi:ureidoglycolate hydrolase
MGNKRKRMAGRYTRRAEISGEEAVTFSDGQVVWHSPLFAWRVKQVAEAVRA